MATWLLAIATTFAAFRSAWYLFKSSQISAVPDWVEVGREEPTDPLQFQLGWMNALMKAREKWLFSTGGPHLDWWDCCAGRSHDDS